MEDLFSLFVWIMDSLSGIGLRVEMECGRVEFGMDFLVGGKLE